MTNIEQYNLTLLAASIAEQDGFPHTAEALLDIAFHMRFAGSGDSLKPCEKPEFDKCEEPDLMAPEIKPF